jgi:two-component system, NarL family, response regulator DesR
VIRTLVAERFGLMRTGLIALLTNECDIEVVAEIDRPEVLLSAAREVRPDVAVVDADMAGEDRFATIRELHVTVPSCRSLIMAFEPSPSDLRQAVEARAAGFVRKDTPPGELSEAIRRLAMGKKVLDPDLAFAALNTNPSPLTSREADVLRLAAQGARATEIARELYLSVGTVRNYLSRVIGKTGARTRVEAIRIADRSGWL